MNQSKLTQKKRCHQEWQNRELQGFISPLRQQVRGQNSQNQLFWTLEINQKLTTTIGVLNVEKVDKIQYDSIVGFLFSGHPSPILQLGGGLWMKAHITGVACHRWQYKPCSQRSITVDFDLAGGSLKDWLRGLLVNGTPLEHAQSWGDLPRGPCQKHLKACTITATWSKEH